MRMRIAPIAGLIAALIAADGVFLFVRWASSDASAERITAPVAVPVVAETLKGETVPIYLSGVGTVIAYNTVVVRSQIQGQITRIAFAEGQTVKTGDVLAQIDPRPYQAQLDQMVATRDRDRAQLVNAEANLARYTDLEQRAVATEQLLDTQKAQVAQLQAAVRADEALIEASKLQLEYTRLSSPITGVTGFRQVDIGNIIHPTDPNGLVVVTQIEPISVIFTLPEGDLPKIQQQMEKGPLSVAAFSQDNQIRLDEGKLELVDNEIQQTTGTIRLRANFPNEHHRLWPGELVNIRLLLENRTDSVTVPASAVQQGPNGSYVYIIGSDKKVTMRPVVVGQSDGGRDLVESGLRAGDAVVADGQYRLQPGSLVQLLQGTNQNKAELESSVQRDIP